MKGFVWRNYDAMEFAKKKLFYLKYVMTVRCVAGLVFFLLFEWLIVSAVARSHVCLLTYVFRHLGRHEVVKVRAGSHQ